jgi:hypothetical protein
MKAARLSSGSGFTQHRLSRLARAFGAEPSPVAQVLSDALRIRREIDEKGLTLAEAANANALILERLRQERN